MKGQVLTRGDSRTKKVGGHCGAKKKEGGHGYTTFSIIATEIPLSSGFTLLLLRIQRYMWRNNIAT